MVPHVDQDAIALGVSGKQHFGVGMGEFERVVQQIHERCEQQVLVAINLQKRVDIGNRQCASQPHGIKVRCQFRISDKRS